MNTGIEPSTNLIDPPINLYEIYSQFSLTEDEISTVKRGINHYSSTNSIKRVARSCLYYPQSVLGNTSWQKAAKVLESKIDGERSEEVAIFLLTYCLTKDRMAANQFPLPIPWDVWIRGDLGNLTLGLLLKRSECTNNNLPIERRNLLGGKTLKS